jgi:hypothetical protein
VADSNHAPANLPDVQRTMKAAHRAKLEGGQAIIKARELVEAHFYGRASLSLAARKMLNILIGKAAGDAWVDQSHVITKKELRGSHKANDRLGAILDELMEAKFKVQAKSQRGADAVLTAAMLSWNIEEQAQDGLSIVEWQFSEPARALFKESAHYARLDRHAILRIRSKYTLTIYELGCLVIEQDHKIIRATMQQLRLLLGVPDSSLQNFSDFKRVVLQAAKNEIGKFSKFTFEWTAHEAKNRRVARIELKFNYRSSVDRPSLPTEISASSPIKRDTRFPKGVLEFGDVEDYFADIARRHGGGWAINAIADEFRKWSHERLATVCGPRLVKVFEGFCKSYVASRGAVK